jgi:hypothetical protein
MCPAREYAAGGRETPGRLSWGYTFFAAKERVQKKLVATALKALCDVRHNRHGSPPDLVAQAEIPGKWSVV